MGDPPQWAKLEGRLHRVTTPTLVLWGEADGFVPAAHGEGYAERIAGASLERIADAGHLPVIEQPEGGEGLPHRVVSAAWTSIVASSGETV